MSRSRAVGLAASLALGTCALLSAPRQAAAAEATRLNGSGSGLDMMKPLLQGYAVSHPDDPVRMGPPLGSSGAMRALLAGALDIAVISRPVASEEVALGARARPYGRTPLLIVTHRGLGQKDVTTTQLEAIYTGKRTTWPNGERIRVILRPEKDIVTKLLRGLSPGMEAADVIAHKQPWAIVAVTDPESNELVASTPGAIGAAALTSVTVTRLPLDVLTLDGVEGTAQAVAQGRYPLAKDFIFVATAKARAPALAIIEFAFSSEGRAIAEKAGVLLTPAGGHVR
jgi:phosphate transport system substrate-binding protein